MELGYNYRYKVISHNSSWKFDCATRGVTLGVKVGNRSLMISCDKLRYQECDCKVDNTLSVVCYKRHLNLTIALRRRDISTAILIKSECVVELDRSTSLPKQINIHTSATRAHLACDSTKHFKCSQLLTLQAPPSLNTTFNTAIDTFSLCRQAQACRIETRPRASSKMTTLKAASLQPQALSLECKMMLLHQGAVQSVRMRSFLLHFLRVN